MNYPIMYPEIVEALKSHWKDNEDILADCLIHLVNISDTPKMRYDIEDELANMGRCIKCGTKLEYHEWKEKHPEVSPDVYEIMRELFCPNCEGVNNDQARKREN